MITFRAIIALFVAEILQDSTIAGAAGTDEVVKVSVNGTGVFGCHRSSMTSLNASAASGHPQVVQLYRRDREMPVFLKIGISSLHMNRRFRGRIKYRPDTATVRISPVRLEDEGRYACKLIYDVSEDIIEEGKQDWIKLFVTDRPRFRNAAQLRDVVERTEGEELHLRCAVSGRPTPQVTWRKDGWIITQDEFVRALGDELSISSVQKRHRGRYTCHARNSEGKIEHITLLRVRAPPEVKVAPENVTAKEGDDAYFKCKASGYPSEITYAWFLNGDSVPHAKRLPNRGHCSVRADGSLVVSGVSRKDAGRVTCRAANEYGNAPTVSAQLTVQYVARVLDIPKTVHGGLDMPITLRCPSDANPPANAVTWRKDGIAVMNMDQRQRVYVTSDGSLVISRVAVEDQAHYTCKPYNHIGSAGESPRMRLEVCPPPRFVHKPPDRIIAETGDGLNVTCAGAGHPLPTVKWTKIDGDSREVRHNGHRVKQHGNDLIINRVKKIDNGRWKCTVSNSVASISRDMMLYVKYTTPHPATIINVTTSSTTALIIWSPGFDGGHRQTFMIWYKKANKGDHAWVTKYSENPEFSETISGLVPETVYQFAVLAENSIGSGPFSHTVSAMTSAFPVTIAVTTPAHRVVSPPRNLTYFLTERGLIVLRWKCPDDHLLLLGYLIEYRVVAGASDGSEFPAAASTTKPNADRSSRWKRLRALPGNATKFVVAGDAPIYRDRLYEFQVVAVTSAVYSAPSKSVFVATAGMTVYRALDVSTATIISGAVVGTAFVLVSLLLLIRFCVHRRRRRKDVYVLDSASSTYENECDEKFLARRTKTPRDLLNSDGNSTTTCEWKPSDRGALCSRQAEEYPTARSKTSTSASEKSKIRRNHTSVNADDKQRRFSLKRSKSSCCTKDESRGRLETIRRSADGKFRLNGESTDDEGSPGNDDTATTTRRKTRQPNHHRHSTPRGLEHATRSRRPLSDSAILRSDAPTTMRFSPDVTTIAEEGSPPTAQLEIDCSASDIEVRYTAPPLSNRADSVVVESRQNRRSQIWSPEPRHPLNTSSSHLNRRLSLLPPPRPASACYSAAMSAQQQHAAARHRHSVTINHSWSMYSTAPRPASFGCYCGYPYYRREPGVRAPAANFNTLGGCSNSNSRRDVDRRSTQPRTAAHSLARHSFSLPSLARHQPNVQRRSASFALRRSASDVLTAPRDEATQRASVTCAGNRMSSRDDLTFRLELKDDDVVEERASSKTAAATSPTPKAAKTSPPSHLDAVDEVTSSGYESQSHASSASSDASSAARERHLASASTTLPHPRYQHLQRRVTPRPASFAFRDRRQEASARFHLVAAVAKRRALSSAHPAPFADLHRSRKDNSSVDEKYEWDSEFELESDILEALEKLDTTKGMPSRVAEGLRKLGAADFAISVDHKFSTSTDELLAFSQRDTKDWMSVDITYAHAVDSGDMTYSKESMERRCAELKKEYLQYKIMHDL